MTLHKYAETRYSSWFFYFNELKQGRDSLRCLTLFTINNNNSNKLWNFFVFASFFLLKEFDLAFPLSVLAYLLPYCVNTRYASYCCSTQWLWITFGVNKTLFITVLFLQHAKFCSSWQLLHGITFIFRSKWFRFKRSIF